MPVFDEAFGPKESFLPLVKVGESRELREELLDLTESPNDSRGVKLGDIMEFLPPLDLDLALGPKERFLPLEPLEDDLDPTEFPKDNAVEDLLELAEFPDDKVLLYLFLFLPLDPDETFDDGRDLPFGFLAFLLEFLPRDPAEIRLVDEGWLLGEDLLDFPGVLRLKNFF